MGSAASSSSSSSAPLFPKKNDVFISFRGEDTRRTITSHLYTALCQRNIKTYIDYELRKGDEISQTLSNAIEESSISVVIFSKNYVSSKWCLNELTKIRQCKEDQGQVVIPVFYKVDPSHVRNQVGTYKETFAKHEQDLKHNQKKLNQWKHALFSIASLAGWTWNSRTYRDESELIQNVVNDVLEKMNGMYPSALNGLVGIEDNCECIELLLKEVPIIGIWGMGGIGKTTMAKTVFDKLSSQFESCCFLENLREEIEKHGLTHIRDKLLLELLNEENLYNGKPRVGGSTFAMRRLSSKKVFIVLDDVSNSKQLEYLASNWDCLGLGSKVIITTRDKQLLNGRVNEIYEAKPLSYYKSLELFNLKAFHAYHPKIGYEQLSKRAVDYAKGIPLALIVLGLFLRSKTTKEWDSALTKLTKTPNEDILEVLKLSYDGLNYEEKEMFLDIACFLKGENEEHVTTLLENYGFHASIGLRTLLDNGLITIDGRVWMHDLIQKMGCEIFHQECIKEPGKRSRLYDPKEVYDVLKNNTGTDAIEGIILDLSQIKDIHLSADTFKRMTNIRFLKIYSPWHRRSYNVNLPTGLESLSDRLRYLQWDGYPLESLPSAFCPENLVELRMRGSHIKKLWDGVQNVVNLRRIYLDGSKQLIELPDFSKAQNLELVDLSSCESLCYVHPSILSLPRLVALRLYNCTKLKSLQSESPLESLRDLFVGRCISLTEFSSSSEEITNLELETTGIELLDSSIGLLRRLKKLCLDGSRLRSLPINDLCYLTSLQELHLSNCEQVIDEQKLHVLFEALKSLQKVYLDGCCNLTELPNNIKYLSRLQVLSLRNCESLQSLPELPPFIEELDATNCTLLETIVLTSSMEFPMLPIGHLSGLKKLRLNVSSLKNFSIYELCYMRSLKELTLYGCGPVIDTSKLHMLFGALRSLGDLYLHRCINLSELPDNISALSLLYLLGLEKSSVQSLPASIKHLSKLDYVYLTNCWKLRSLPELPPFTKYVKATNCTSLETVFPSTTSRPRRRYLVDSLFLENCMKLDEDSLCRIKECAYFSLKRVVYINQMGAVCYPGSSVPKWFGYIQTTEASSSITIELSSGFNSLLGFVFCSVLPQFSSEQNCPSYLNCRCYFEDGQEVEGIGDDGISVTGLNFDHVFLWYDPVYSAFILKELIEREDDLGNTYKPTLSFEFCVRTYSANYGITEHGDLIKACGVCPIYASDYHNFLHQMESELELSTKTKSCHDIDEHSPFGIMEYAKSSLKFEGSIISDPRSRVPDWFKYKVSTTTEDSISVEIDSSDFGDNLLGFVFCFVIPQFTSKEKDQSHSGCRCSYGDSFNLEGPRGWHYSMTELNSHNVFLWHDPLYCELILEKVRRRSGNYDEGPSNYNPKLSFEFEFGDSLIKECGVRPICAAEYTNFLQQMELKLELGTKKKREEQEQLPPTKKLQESSVFGVRGDYASENQDEIEPLSKKNPMNSSSTTFCD